MRGGARLRNNLIRHLQTSSRRSPLGPRQAAVANLAVRYAALPPCTCGYLGGAASGALGRTVRGREGRRRLHGTARRVRLHRDVFRCSARLVVIPRPISAVVVGIMGMIMFGLR